MERIDKRFAGIDGRLDSLNQSVTQGFIAMGVGLGGDFVALATLIVATQL